MKLDIYQAAEKAGFTVSKDFQGVQNPYIMCGWNFCQDQLQAFANVVLEAAAVRCVEVDEVVKSAGIGHECAEAIREMKG